MGHIWIVGIRRKVTRVPQLRNKESSQCSTCFTQLFQNRLIALHNIAIAHFCCLLVKTKSLSLGAREMLKLSTLLLPPRVRVHHTNN